MDKAGGGMRKAYRGVRRRMQQARRRGRVWCGIIVYVLTVAGWSKEGVEEKQARDRLTVLPWLWMYLKKWN
jgi:hypothetical protein